MKLIPMVLVLMLSNLALAQSKQNSVLDFDADIIEGEKRKPDIMIQLGKENQTFDSVLFKRKDFNDFHREDMKRRPLYHESLSVINHDNSEGF